MISKDILKGYLEFFYDQMIGHIFEYQRFGIYYHDMFWNMSKIKENNDHDNHVFSDDYDYGHLW